MSTDVMNPFIQWVFYWPAIFNAITFVILFFFLEETNYNRKATALPTTSEPPMAIFSPEYDTEKADALTSQKAASIEIGTKTQFFTQKLSLWQPSPGQSMLGRAKRSLKYLSWPVIFYAGFSYGSYLIWFNVLNATASIILGGPGYNFKASMVGLSYVYVNRYA